MVKLIHDFKCSDAGDMKLSLLAKRTKYFKETIEGVSYMCLTIEEIKDLDKQIKNGNFEL